MRTFALARAGRKFGLIPVQRLVCQPARSARCQHRSAGWTDYRTTTIYPGPEGALYLRRSEHDRFAPANRLLIEKRRKRTPENDKKKINQEYTQTSAHMNPCRNLHLLLCHHAYWCISCCVSYTSHLISSPLFSPPYKTR